MTFQEFIGTITAAELDFIAGLNYGQDHDAHRKALDVVIANGGVVDTAKQGVWFPLEVVELGRNSLQKGREREFALCVGIVLQTGRVGDEAQELLEQHMDEINSLPNDLRTMVEIMIEESIDIDRR
ncbi:MAG: hypothetical protein C0404_02535 [Verrucomicrobia bacterium]|nr:hypothetical protein [Verrucomicrobiota bacterium]